MADVKNSEKGDIGYADVSRISVLGASGELRNLLKTDLEANFPGSGGASGVTPTHDPVEVATTANITLSGEQTIDGVLTATDRILVKDQTDETENGIYVTDAGAWARSADANEASELNSAVVLVNSGTTQEGNIYQQTATISTLGSDDVTWILAVTVFDGHDEAPL